jgi:uncharacterized protein YkwD
MALPNSHHAEGVTVEMIMRDKIFLRRLGSIIRRHPVPCLVFSVLSASGPAHAQAQTGASITQTLSGALGSWQYVRVEVPAGAASLDVQLSGGGGDADLYLLAGEKPTETAFSCRPFLVGNDETCTASNPATSIWQVGIHAFAAFNDATLTISWPMQCAAPPEVPAPVPDAPPPVTNAPPPAPDAPPPVTEGPPPPPPVTEAPPPVAATPTAADWLDPHNAARAHHCAPPLTWNEELAASAQAWANQCVFEHAQGAGFGENLFAKVGDSTAADAVDDWYAEIANYDFAAPGTSANSGHFTQVVWKNTTSVGCAVATCPGLFPGFGDASFAVCRYAPQGNIAGGFAANVVPKDAACE